MPVMNNKSTKSLDITKKEKCAATWKRFRSQTTAHGIPHVDNAIGAPKRTFWVFISLGCMAFLAYHIATVSIYYASRPVAVHINLIHATELDFPAVTVCNMNPVKSSELSNSPELQSVLSDSKRRKRKRRAIIDDTIPTYGGNANSENCVFPFIYNDTSYEECTTEDRGGMPWCATTDNYDTNGTWGCCITSGSCPNNIYVSPDGEQICYWNPKLGEKFDYDTSKLLCEDRGASLFILDDPAKQTHVTTWNIVLGTSGKRTWTFLERIGSDWYYKGTDLPDWSSWSNWQDPAPPTDHYDCAYVEHPARDMDNDKDCLKLEAFTMCELYLNNTQPTTMETTTEATTTIQTTTTEMTPTADETTTQTTTAEMTTTADETTTQTTTAEMTTTADETTTQTTAAEMTTTADGTTTQTTAAEMTTTSSPTTTPTATTTTANPTEYLESFTKREEVLGVLAAMSIEQKQSLGYQPDEFLLSCQYAGYPCLSSQFSFFYDPMHGNCYIFNAAWSNNSQVLKSTRPGRRYGLKLELNVNQDEYVDELGEAAGVSVVIHHQTHMPFPQDDGIVAPPGMLTSIGLNLMEIARIDEPYGECVDPTVANLDRNVYEEIYPVRYTINGCLKTCYQKQMIKQCGCADPQFPAEGEVFGNETVNFCAAETKAKCSEVIQKWYKENVASCNCPPSCSETTYISDTSNAQWPSNVHRGDILSDMITKTAGSSLNLTDSTVFYDNLLTVEVYYQQFNYKKIKEKPAYPDPTYFSDLGGILGLWIGCSILSLFEFVELVVDLSVIGLFCGKSKRTVAVNNTDIADKSLERPPPQYTRDTKPSRWPPRPSQPPISARQIKIKPTAAQELEMV